MNRRGSALWATLLVVVVATGIAAAMMSAADVSGSDTARQDDRARLRALAWSGVESVMSQLAAQRDTILAGGDPAMAPDLANSDTLEGTVTLVPWTSAADTSPLAGPVAATVPSNASNTPAPSKDASAAPTSSASTALAADAPLWVSENARLELSIATPDMIHTLAGEDADKLLAAHPSSIEEALGVGRRDTSADALPGASAPKPAQSGDPKPNSIPATSSGSAGNAASLLTTFSIDPNITAGISALGVGQHRISIAADLTADAQAKLSKGLSDAARDAGLAVATATEHPKTASDLFIALVNRGLAPEIVAELADTFTVSTEDFVPGLVDLNRAPAAVLATLPGLDESTAQQIVDHRAGLSADQRKRLTWPWEVGVLTPEQFGKLAPMATIRSTQWRVRVQATLGKPAKDASGETPVARHGKRMVYEAVIDIATLRPRVAYLREVTFDTATALAAAQAKPKQATTAPDLTDTTPPPSEAPQAVDIPPPAALDATPPPPDDSTTPRVRRNGRWTAH